MALSGLVLHPSRAGATPLLRGLAAWPGVVGVDDSQELDDALLHARRGGGPAPLTELLERFGGLGEHVVVRADSWHTLEAEQLLAAAGVPWVFVHRDPAEVLVSHLWNPGSQMVPGVLDEAWFGRPTTFLHTEHGPGVIGAIYAAAAEVAGPGTLVDYADLREDLPRVAARFGLDPAAGDDERVDQALFGHARRGHVYEDDRAAKQAAVTPELAAVVAQRIQPAYDALLAAGTRVEAA